VNYIIKHIILFEQKQDQITIINSLVQFTIFDIKNVSHFLFQEFSDVFKIQFRNIFINNINGKSCFFKNKAIFLEALNDAILELPHSLETYFGKLGAQTRKHIKYYQNRILKDIPGFRTMFIKDNDILFDHIYNIIELNRARMLFKGTKSGIDDLYCINLYKYARIHGVLCLCCDGNKIIGGTINSLLGDQAFLHVIAHDNMYSKYNTGQIALVNTIQYLIEKEINIYHMLWGDCEYKYRFLSERYSTYNIISYRKTFNFCIDVTGTLLRRLPKLISSKMIELKRGLKKNVLVMYVYHNLKKYAAKNC
jgi:hypothetical protein